MRDPGVGFVGRDAVRGIRGSALSRRDAVQFLPNGIQIFDIGRLESSALVNYIITSSKDSFFTAAFLKPREGF